MSKKLLPLLDGTPNKTWDIQRHIIVKKIIGTSFSTVPTIMEAQVFDLWRMYIKLEKGRNPLYKVIGWLSDYIDRARSRSDAIENMPIFIEPTRMASICELYVEDTERDMSTRVFNCRHESIPLAKLRKGDLYVVSHPDLRNVGKVYIISDVLMSERLYMWVRIQQREVITNLSESRLPIAFRSYKFNLLSDGSLSSGKLVRTRISSNDCRWDLSDIDTEEIEFKPLLPLIKHSQHLPDESPSTRVSSSVDSDFYKDHQKKSAEWVMKQ